MYLDIYEYYVDIVSPLILSVSYGKDAKIGFRIEADGTPIPNGNLKVIIAYSICLKESNCTLYVRFILSNCIPTRTKYLNIKH